MTAGLASATLGLAASPAKALTVTVPVTVGGISQNYDVTTFSGTYIDNTSKFTTTDMPWWGDSTLADQFASAVGVSSGLDGNFDGSYGPLFAYQTRGASTTNAYIYDGGMASPDYYNNAQTLSYAIASLASSPPAASSTASVPGPLPILGLAAAFGFSRKLRRRINLHKGTGAVSISAGA